LPVEQEQTANQTAQGETASLQTYVSLLTPSTGMSDQMQAEIMKENLEESVTGRSLAEQSMQAPDTELQAKEGINACR